MNQAEIDTIKAELRDLSIVLRQAELRTAKLQKKLEQLEDEDDEETPTLYP